MKVIDERNFIDVFPMRIKCQREVDSYGFTYGEEKDFCGSELEIDPNDIKKHDWFKYPCYEGTDYGVVCPICGQFVVVDRNRIPKSVLANAEEIRLNT